MAKIPVLMVILAAVTLAPPSQASVWAPLVSATDGKARLPAPMGGRHSLIWHPEQARSLHRGTQSLPFEPSQSSKGLWSD
jgi:hypothetical protein